MKTLKAEFFCLLCGKARKTSGDVAVRIADHDRDTGVGLFQDRDDLCFGKLTCRLSSDHRLLENGPRWRC